MLVSSIDGTTDQKDRVEFHEANRFTFMVELQVSPKSYSFHIFNKLVAFEIVLVTQLKPKLKLLIWKYIITQT